MARGDIPLVREVLARLLVQGAQDFAGASTLIPQAAGDLVDAHGSVFAFFLLNAGVIALVRPVAVDDETRRFYLPLALAAVLIVSALVRFGTVSRLAGVVVVALYVGFFIGGYV